MILGTYKIEYEGGVIQIKNLISKELYTNVICPISDVIDFLERKNKGKKTPETKKLQSFINETFGELIFTDDSPLFLAIETGVIKLHKNQGGNHKCKITKVNVLDIK